MSDTSLSLGNGALSTAAIPVDVLIKDTTNQAFPADVLEESRRQPVLVDFWAPWCGPCKQLTPVLEKVVKQAGGAVRLVKMNIDDHPQIAGQLGIQSIPAVIAFVDGRPVDGFMGALPEGQVKEFVERIAGPGGPSEIDSALAEADALIEQGATEEAAQLFGAILAAQPDELRAVASLAGLHIAAGRTEDAKTLLDAVPEAKANDPVIAGLKAQLALLEQTAGLGDESEFRARIAANPKDFEAMFDLALLVNAKDDREEATDLLLDIFRLNRSWEEEKARKQLVQFFEAWGPTDEATLSGRRRLSSLLFS